MSTANYALRDTRTMMRRNFRHSMRYPLLMISSLGVPLIMLILFRFVLGGSIAPSVSSGPYIDYVAPGVILIAAIMGASGTAIAVNTDMKSGIIKRFRTMGISRGSVLAGHVVRSVIQTVIGTALVVGITLAVGFRPKAGLTGWLGALGIVVMLAFALTWLVVAFGLVAQTPEGANSSTLIFQVLPFVSSAFVRPESMPTGVQWFAEHQPFTPFIDAVRGLLMGTPVGNSVLWSAVWCVVLSLVGYVWARSAFERSPSR
ncbi:MULTISPECIES: ABC transporter permease [unclassified Kitasatospora]|uniref:ABC transporter permease n=1 Tax=unclassified Kitasatospora TaxID=2633591 RepID=UPI0024766D5F|nr:ABC transporter permease [Kitasatospora sp. MAA19]MDH6705979.1 ABC-2 type transport system permease protein [Kitasatospora sp. MAA19]